MKELLINLYVTERFKVKGEERLVELYTRRMAVERAFKASKIELLMEKPKWRGVAKSACTWPYAIRTYTP